MIVLLGFVKLNKVCKKCKIETIHRFVKDKRRSSYYSCSLCLERNSKKYRQKYWEKYLAQKANSRKRKGSIIITEQMIKNLNKDQNNKCALTFVEFDLTSKWYRPSLDRIDSNLGYVESNIRLVAWIVNHTRGNLTDLEFIDMCNKVSYNMSKENT